ncbi:MAG: efflux RND transporter periplasmic adaptor subunit [Bryobacteraceae bacterium]|jgi:RND family efflux transporter MFP subunit
MKKLWLAAVVAAAFAGGYGYARWYGTKAPRAAATPKILYWVDAMHPWYKSDHPGIAPDCGMKLVPVYAGDEQKYVADNPGMVGVSAREQQLIGVEYGTAEYESVGEPIRAVARVALDETRVAKVQPRLEGWIDRVFADFTGKYIRQGDPLLTFYSPDAVATEQEYLLALRAQQVAHEGMPGMAAHGDSLLAAARKRLELWDIPTAQIDAMARAGKPIESLTLNAPVSGFVIERNAFPKQHVTPDTALYTIADLSKVWVIADVFEYEAAGIRLGQGAAFTLDYLPGRVFYGRVSYILPEVDAATRTLKVRIALDNPGIVLKPDMFGQVELAIGTARRLVVPQSALLDSGDRKTVFVDRGTGSFEQREVQTGDTSGDRVAILSGLKAGERIVTSGNFLLDSESRLNAAKGGTSK